MRLRRLHAFTLVELLVVIGIITTLVALLLPATQRARMSALQISCASNMKQIGIAIYSYAVENRGATPPSCYDDTHTYNAADPSMNWAKFTYPTASYQPISCGAGGYLNWMSILWKYHRGPKIYICPAAAYPNAGWTYQLNPNFCPAYVFSGVNAATGFSYEMNNPPGSMQSGDSYPLIPQGFAWNWPYLRTLNLSWKFGAFKYVQDKILLCDSRQGIGPSAPGVYVFQRDRLWWGLYALGGTTTQGGFVVDWNTFGGGGIDVTHRGQANCLMLDGSVRSFDGRLPRPLNDNGAGWLSFDTYASWWRPDIPTYYN